MSKVISVAGAGVDRLTVKMAVVVPLFPSATVTSLMIRLGGEPATQLLNGELLLRGNGAETRKSAALSFVSAQPPALRRSAVVLPGAGPRPEPSKQLAVVTWPTRATTLTGQGEHIPA